MGNTKFLVIELLKHKANVLIMYSGRKNTGSFLTL